MQGRKFADFWNASRAKRACFVGCQPTGCDKKGDFWNMESCFAKCSKNPIYMKKWNNHRAALALFFRHYNSCRKPRTLKRLTLETVLNA